MLFCRRKLVFILVSFSHFVDCSKYDPLKKKTKKYYVIQNFELDSNPIVLLVFGNHFGFLSDYYIYIYIYYRITDFHTNIQQKKEKKIMQSLVKVTIYSNVHLVLFLFLFLKFHCFIFVSKFNWYSLNKLSWIEFITK